MVRPNETDLIDHVATVAENRPSFMVGEQIFIGMLCDALEKVVADRWIYPRRGAQVWFC